ncbi:MAG: hypothetical protein HC880_02175 [Bacteroidia bacterium]|nr:hypothetical protein [Bacteroidia bacterium]
MALGERVDSFEPLNGDFIFDRGTENVLWGGIFSAGLKMGSFNQIGFNFMYNRSGEQNTFELGGENGSRRDEYYSSVSLLYEERSLASYQLSGNHAFGRYQRFNLSWSGAYTLSTIDHPDWRFFVYFNDIVDPEVNPATSIQLIRFFENGEFPPIEGRVNNADGFFPTRFYRDLEESTINTKFDLSYNLSVGSTIQNAKLKVGGNYLHKDRDFREFSFAYRYVQEGITESRSAFISQLLPVLENPESGDFFGEGVFINNNYTFRNNYNADQDVYAGYAMVDIKIGEKFRIVTAPALRKPCCISPATPGMMKGKETCCPSSLA